MKALNINAQITFKPTAAGIQQIINSYNESFALVKERDPEYYKNVMLTEDKVLLDNEGNLKMQLHEFMNVFGSRMIMGNPTQYIHHNTIFINDHDLKEF